GADGASPYSSAVTVTEGTLAFTRDFAWNVSTAAVTLYVADQMNDSTDQVYVPLFAWNPAYHSLTYSAANLPDGLSIDSATGTISGTLGRGAYAASPYSVTITATDTITNVSDTQTFIWTVTQASVNDPGPMTSLVGVAVYLPMFASGAFLGAVAFSASG